MIPLAGTLIVGFSTLMWTLSYFPGPGIENSYLSHIGRLLWPISSLLGFDWRITLALLSGLLAKENTLSTLAILFKTSKESLIEVLRTSIGWKTAFTMMSVHMLMMPCVATLSCLKSEGGTRIMVFSLVYTTILALLVGILTRAVLLFI